MNFSLTRAHQDRMVLEAKGLGIKPIRYQEFEGQTYVWLPLNPLERTNIRNTIVWQFMKKYANWASTYREPALAPEPAKAEVVDLKQRRGSTNIDFKS